jgi:hypothetical protein
MAILGVLEKDLKFCHKKAENPRFYKGFRALVHFWVNIMAVPRILEPLVL